MIINYKDIFKKDLKWNSNIWKNKYILGSKHSSKTLIYLFTSTNRELFIVMSGICARVDIDPTNTLYKFCHNRISGSDVKNLNYIWKLILEKPHFFMPLNHFTTSESYLSLMVSESYWQITFMLYKRSMCHHQYYVMKKTPETHLKKENSGTFNNSYFKNVICYSYHFSLKFQKF